MNTTTNYSLPQWEDTDRVTRGDVNSAMAAIDAALAGVSPWVKLVDYTVAVSGATRLEAPFPDGFNIDDYAMLRIRPYLFFDAYVSGTPMLFNDVASGYRRDDNSCSYAADCGADVKNNEGTAIEVYPTSKYLYTHYRKLLTKGGATENIISHPWSPATTPLTKLTFTTEASGGFLAGCRVLVYGLRK